MSLVASIGPRLVVPAALRREVRRHHEERATVISRQGMFIAAIVGSVAYVALGIMRLVSLEVIELWRAPWGIGPW